MRLLLLLALALPCLAQDDAERWLVGEPLPEVEVVEQRVILVTEGVDGRPLVDTPVEFWQVGHRPGDPPVLTGRTDDDGVFEGTASLPVWMGQGDMVLAKVVGYEGICWFPERFKDGSLEYTYAAQEGPLVHGRVVDAAGDSLGGVLVQLRNAQWPKASASRTLSASDGSFVVRGYFPGPGELEVFRGGFGTLEVDVPEEGELVLSEPLVAKGARTVRGTMRYPSGAPARRVTVWARTKATEQVTSEMAGLSAARAGGDGLQFLETETDDEGRFELRGMTDEALTVFGRGCHEVTVEPGATQAELVCERRRLVITYPEYAPSIGSNVVVDPRGRGYFFSIHDVAPYGKLVHMVRGTSRQTWPAELWLDDELEWAVTVGFEATQGGAKPPFRDGFGLIEERLRMPEDLDEAVIHLEVPGHATETGRLRVRGVAQVQVNTALTVSNPVPEPLLDLPIGLGGEGEPPYLVKGDAWAELGVGRYVIFGDGWWRQIEIEAGQDLDLDVTPQPAGSLRLRLTADSRMLFLDLLVPKGMRRHDRKLLLGGWTDENGARVGMIGPSGGPAIVTRWKEAEELYDDGIPVLPGRWYTCAWDPRPGTYTLLISRPGSKQLVHSFEVHSGRTTEVTLHLEDE